MAEEKKKITREGWAKIEEEYRHLIDVERPEVTEQLAAARAQGDLSENADYDAARNRQATIEARINEIEHLKDVIEIIDVADGASGQLTIGIGTKATLKNLNNGDEYEVMMVGTLEADATGEVKNISDESAIGKAIKGHKVGDEVLVETAKPFTVKILDVHA